MIYELNYLISPELSEEEAKDFQEKIVSFIKENEGIFLEVNKLLRKRLAYEIKGQTQAYLASLAFRLNPEKIAVLEKELKAQAKILRYIILRKEEPKAITFRPGLKPLVKKPPALTKEKKVELEKIGEKLEEILK